MSRRPPANPQLKPGANNPELIVVGRIGAPYGVRGWVRVTSYTDPPSNLGSYQPWHLPNETLEPVKLKPHQNGFVAELAGVQDRDAAARLAGSDIRIDAAQLVPTQGDEFYWRDLVGLAVLDPLGKRHGLVQELLETGAHDVLVIGCTDGREVLVPFVNEFVQHIDLAAKTLVVDWPELSASSR